ncbi:hypothetical protein AQUCO_03200025v1 [Aquilegia coerulea]|uniref:Uncharacterized protein n=1 Tax=Aquilegia coerulea TaxID=218851 RepID=A0A2G5CZS1_AQUCA|nr:hypothetical protein AQUCO_03200025v1 [Aquilegia coerulea]
MQENSVSDLYTVTTDGHQEAVKVRTTISNQGTREFENEIVKPAESYDRLLFWVFQAWKFGFQSSTILELRMSLYTVATDGHQEAVKVWTAIST